MGNRRNRGILDGPIAQFWLERTPDKREVGSSSLPRPTSFFWRACPDVAREEGGKGVGERGLARRSQSRTRWAESGN